MDAPPGACALRPVLAGLGFEPSSDGQWLHFYRPLSTNSVGGTDVVTRSVTDDVIATERVAVQRAAFDGSTYTLDQWRLVAGGPAYRPDLDLVVYADGAPAAVATGWTAGEGRCGLIEPLGTDPAYRGRGLGAAAALYRSCGFGVVALNSAMRRRATPSA